MAKILAISGSYRPGGNTDTLLRQFVAGAVHTGAEVETYFLRNYDIQSCVGCERCKNSEYCINWHDGMDLLYPRIEASHGLIIGSPVYNYNITSILKAFIDRLYPFYITTNDRPRQFTSRFSGQGRKAIVFAVSEQTKPDDSVLALPAIELPLEVLGYSVAWKKTFMGFFGQKDISKDENSLNMAYDAGVRLGKLICET
jgi:multimeric flavodoxin WrbA